jgi:hypothetical protein
MAVRDGRIFPSPVRVWCEIPTRGLPVRKDGMNHESSLTNMCRRLSLLYISVLAVGWLESPDPESHVEMGFKLTIQGNTRMYAASGHVEDTWSRHWQYRAET